MPKHGILFMSGFGLRLRVQNGHLSAEWGIGAERHHARLARINRNLKRVIVVGSDGFATFDAIRWIADIGASLIFLDRRGKLLFASTPSAPSDVRLRRAQSLAFGNGVALRICRELIAQKLDGQAALVRDMLHNSVAADAILRSKADLAETESIDAVRLVESVAAKIYWSQWTNVPIRWVRKDEPRVPTHWKRFTSRISPITHSPRLATNPANASMNLIHALCEAECRMALIATGLDPEIGLLHRDAPNRSSLANDLQEIVRPMVDAFVLNWIQTEFFRKADFWEDKDGNCRLMSQLCAKLSETSSIWRRAVLPVAEWIAQVLWSSTGQSTSKKATLPTRLTQRRRTEGRGKAFIIIPPSPPPAPKVCSGCGATTHEGRLCQACGRKVSGEKLIELAKRGRVVAQSFTSQMKRSTSQTRHEAAKRAWRSVSNQTWPDEKTYETEIGPRLSSVTISTLLSALGVCESYAADVRAGRRRPHPRHWQALAELVGVSEP